MEVFNEQVNNICIKCKEIKSKEQMYKYGNGYIQCKDCRKKYEHTVILCECGKTFTMSNGYNHRRTKFHNNYY